MEGEAREYTCQVPDINPAANFFWTVGSLPLTPDGNENDAADGLITSRSMATLTATWSNHGEIFKCRATNDGSLGISINVMLDVKGKEYKHGNKYMDGAFSPREVFIANLMFQ